MLPFGLDTKSLIIGLVIGAVVLPIVQTKLAARKA